MNKIIKNLALVIFLSTFACSITREELYIVLQGGYGCIAKFEYVYELKMVNRNYIVEVRNNSKSCTFPVSLTSINKIIEETKKIDWKNIPESIGEQYTTADFIGTFTIEYKGNKTISKSITLVVGQLKNSEFEKYINYIMNLINEDCRLWCFTE